MAIKVSVRYNDGILPDVILLTLCYYHRGTRLKAIRSLCPRSLCSHLNVLTIFPSLGGDGKKVQVRSDFSLSNSDNDYPCAPLLRPFLVETKMPIKGYIRLEVLT